MLIEEAESFKATVSEFTVNTKIYKAAAMRPEELFAVKNITGEIKVALSDGTVKEIGSGSLGIKIEEVKVNPTQTAAINQPVTITDGSTQISTANTLK